MMKRTREDYTKEQLITLEQAWNDGMRSSGKDHEEKIFNISQSLGVSVERVKEWIGNRNAKDRRDRMGSKGPVKNKVNVTRGVNAYQLFARTIKRGTMDGSSYLAHLSQEWKTLPEEQKQQYRERAKLIRQDPLKGMSRDDVILSQLKVINQACGILESVGYEAYGMGFDPKQQSAPSNFGTPLAFTFIDSELEEKFRTFVSGTPIVQTVRPNTEDERKCLRLLVRKHMNEAWRKSTNLKMPIPYKEIAEGKIEVEIDGLPEGVGLKNPSSYGLETLKKIRASSAITFKIRNKEHLGNAEHDPNEIMENAVNDPVIPQSKKNQISDKSANEIMENAVNDPVIPQSKKNQISDKSANEIMENAVNDLVIPQSKKNQISDKSDTRKRKQDSESTDDKAKHANVDTSSQPCKSSKLSSEDVDILAPILLDPATQELASPEEDELFEIEQIVKERGRKNKKEVLVKWKGYDEPTWIPKEDIVDIS